MMIYLWYSKSTCVTGRALGRLLGIRFGMRVPPRGTTLTICWGARLPRRQRLLRSSRRRIENMNWINDIYSVEHNAHKLKALQTMEREDVKVPHACHDFQVRDELIMGTMTYPFIGRRYYHQCGHGFYMCRDGNDMLRALPNVDYFVKYVPNEREYRVQMYKEEVLRISKKVQCEYDADQHCRSNDRGWHYQHKRWRNAYQKLVEASRMALESLSLDFGGIDLVVDGNGSVWIIEVNTGVGLGESGLEIYANAITEDVGEENVHGR